MPSGDNATTGSWPSYKNVPLVSNPPKGCVRCSACAQAAKLPTFFLTAFVTAKVISTLTDVSCLSLLPEPKGQRWFSLDAAVSLRSGVQLRCLSLCVVKEFHS